MVPDREDPLAQWGAAAGQPPLRVFLRRPLLQRRYDSLLLIHLNRLLEVKEGLWDTPLSPPLNPQQKFKACGLVAW